MNDGVAFIASGVCSLATTLFMRRAGYWWVAALLVGLLSGVAFFYLLAGLVLSLGIVLSHSALSSQLPNGSLLPLVSTVLLIVWCLVGYLLSRSTTCQQRNTAVGSRTLPGPAIPPRAVAVFLGAGGTFWAWYLSEVNDHGIIIALGSVIYSLWLLRALGMGRTYWVAFWHASTIWHTLLLIAALPYFPFVFAFSIPRYPALMLIYPWLVLAAQLSFSAAGNDRYNASDERG
jgi:hypothetical protein